MISRLVLLVSLMIPFVLNAQIPCGQQILENKMRAEDPELDAKMLAYEEQMQLLQNAGVDRSGIKIIPVVFHIIHMNGPENIADEQVYDAMRIINQDYTATNSEIPDIVTAFVNIIGTSDFEFRLAQKDPNGNETNGIDRIVSSQTYVGDDNAKLNPWPRARYLNIWVTDAITVTGANAAAYAYKPAAADGLPAVDGVISNHRGVGSIGTAWGGDQIHTLSHEIGHFFNLNHTWGETNYPGCSGQSGFPCEGLNNCNADDGVLDTPNCIGVDNGGCNVTQVSCSTLDNIQNFMEYSSCTGMFTNGQISRMNAAAASTVAQRSTLSSASTGITSGVTKLYAAKFFLTKRILCRNESFQLKDESMYEPDTWSWTVTGPTTFTSTEQHPTFTFSEPGIYSISLTVTQGAVTESVSESNAIMVLDFNGQSVPFTEDFSNGLNGWITNNHEEESATYVWKAFSTAGNGDMASVKLQNLGQSPNRVDDLVYGGIDFRPLSSISISFDVAYAQAFSTSYDKLQLDISEDCGMTWHQVWASSGSSLAGTNGVSSSAFTPSSSSHWKSVTVSSIPSAWTSEHTAIRFRFTSGNGNHCYLDNINIGGTYSPIPVLVYPADGQANVNNDVTIDWRAVPGVDSYEYQLDENSSFNSSNRQSGTTTFVDDSSENEDTQYTPASPLTNGKTYYWRVRSKSGTSSAWSDIWSFTVADDGVGISEANQTRSVILYPNPALDRLTIESTEWMEMITVYGIDGKVVKYLETNDTNKSKIEIDLSGLTTGAYFVRVTGTSGDIFQHFVISE